MQKVLVFGMTENPGGVESVIMNYYRHLNKEKYQFDFLCNTDVVAYEEEIKKMGGEIYRITARSKNRKQYKNDMNKFFKINSNKYAAIWVNVCSLANIDYLKYAKKYGIKKRIIHSHNSQNMDSKLRSLLHKINKKFVHKYATDFWSCGDEAAKWFYSNKIIKSDNYYLLNNAINTDKFKYNIQIREEYRKQLDVQDKIVFGNIGRFHFQKNHTFIIKIFNEIQKIKPESVLLLIGAGEDEEMIKNMVNNYNIQDKVKFLGLRNDVEKIMQAMDVLLFPSLFEGLPVVLVEAQTSDLLIYASNTISPKSKIKENMKMISLDLDEKEWSKIIIDDLSKKYERTSDISEIINNGYDINEEIKKFEDLLY